jgi:filamentous hemagglutinin family protein
MKNNTISTLRPVALAASLLLASQAYGVGTGTIADGAGTIDKNGATATVTQSSDKLIVNWDNMDVAKRETLNFVQKDASSAVLNRIDSADPTTILGALNANGRVFVVNPNGVLIGKGAKINVGSLIASSLNIKDEDFKADKLNFAGGGNGSVVNQGAISALGSVGLIGPKVQNRGSIKSAGGDVVLAAGDDISLAFSGSSLQARLDKGSLEALVDNGGLIKTNNGDIVLTAWARDALARSVINNTGVLEAKQLKNAGSIELASLGNGEVSIGGTLRTRGRHPGLGAIDVRGQGIHIQDGAKLAAADGNGVIRLTAPPESKSDAAGYVKFGKAALAANFVEITADNVLTSADADQLPSLGAEVWLETGTEDRSVTLGGAPSADFTGQPHHASGFVSAGFVKAASQRSLTVELQGTGDISTEGKLEAGKLEMRADRGNVRLNGDISGRALRVHGGNAALFGTTRADVLNVSADTLSLNGDVTADTLILHANEHAASTGGSLHARSAMLSGRSLDLTRGAISLANLDLQVESADIALNGDTMVCSADVGGDLRLVSRDNLRLNDVQVDGNLDVAAAGTVRTGNVSSEGSTNIRSHTEVPAWAPSGDPSKSL